MIRVADDRLDAVVEARVQVARLLCLNLVGRPLDNEDLSALDRDVVDEAVVLLVGRVAALAAGLLGLDAAREQALIALRTAWSDRTALHTRSPAAMPPGWSPDPENLMSEVMFLSWRLRPPTARCSGCTGELAAGPPYLVDQLSRRTFCDTCAIRAGYRRPVARIRRARAQLELARTDEQVAGIVAALGDGAS